MGNVWEHSMTDLPWATIWEMDISGNCIPHPFAFTIYLLYQNSGERYQGELWEGWDGGSDNHRETNEESHLKKGRHYLRI